MFAPLFPAMARDLHLSGTRTAALLVTIMSVVYFGLAAVTGHLADRFDRRLLLGIGLLGNAIAILLMGFTHGYASLVGLVVVAGVFGALFHPTANSMMPALFPKSPGLAIGLLGIGSGLGFFAGPQLAGWRAESATWGGRIPETMQRWQIPCVELGALGIAVAIIYLLVARDGPHSRTENKAVPLEPWMRRNAIKLASLLCWRDFAGVGSVALLSVYLQRVFGLGLKDTGLILGLMMLLATVVNPLAIWLTGGSRRLPALRFCLFSAAGLMAILPALPLGWLIAALVVLQTMALAASALSDAALAERIAPARRGRINGITLTILGTVAGASNWVVAAGTDVMGARVSQTGWHWWVAFGALAALMLFSTVSVRRLAHLHLEPSQRAGSEALACDGIAATASVT